MGIDLWFASPIGSVVSPKKYELTEYCLELMSKVKSGGDGWVGKPYTTLGTYNILEDSKFKELNTWIHHSVNEFVNTCGYGKVSAVEGWFNYYKKGDYQEYHNHASRYFSCIYYLEAQKDDAYTIFSRHPMSMVQYHISEERKSIPATPLQSCITLETVKYYPTKGKLLIFKSDTLHMVQQKESRGKRISLSYNFIEDGHSKWNIPFE